MKDKVKINLCRKVSGEFVGEIVNEKGEGRRIKSFRHNGRGGISKCLKHIEKEFPDAIVPDII